MTSSAYHFDLSDMETALRSLHDNADLLTAEVREILDKTYLNLWQERALSTQHLLVFLLSIISRVEGDQKRAIVQLQRADWEQLRRTTGAAPTKQIREALSFDPQRVVLEICPRTTV